MTSLLARRTAVWVALAVLLTAAVRLYLLSQYHCISSDGVHYIDAAKDFFAGKVSAGLSSVYPPAYPLLIASAYALLGDWELAGQIISILCGVLLLFPVYKLCDEIYGERVALVACFLVAISPYLARYSVHVRTESPFFFLSTAALLLFYQAIERKLTSRFLFGGLLTGFAYLVRPEAIGFLAIVPVILGVRWWTQRDLNALAFVKFCVLVFFGFSVFALPYAVYLSLETGQWGAVSRKAGVTLGISLKESGLLDADGLQKLSDLQSLTLLEFVSRHPLLYVKKVAMDIPASVVVYFEALHYAYVPFLLLGLFLVFRQKFWQRKDLLLTGFLLFYLLGFALIYVNLRYSVQLVPVSLGWTAVGILWCWSYFKACLSSGAFTALALLVSLGFGTGTLLKTLQPISPEKAHVRAAGRYLKELNGSGNLRLLLFDDRVAFYAEAAPILMQELKEPDGLLEHLRERKADYLATDSRLWQERYPEIAQNPERCGLTLEKEFHGSRNRRLIVFRLI